MKPTRRLAQTLPERNVRRELSQEEIDFNIQRLGVWLTYSQSSAITEPEWEHLKCDKLPAFTGRLFAGIKYGKDNRNVALSVAVRTDDGRIFVEALDRRPISQGNGWLIDFLQQADVEKVIIDGANGQSIFVEEMKDCRVSVKAVLPTVAQVIEANTLFTVPWTGGRYRAFWPAVSCSGGHTLREARNRDQWRLWLSEPVGGYRYCAAGQCHLCLLGMQHNQEGEKTKDQLLTLKYAYGGGNSR